MHPTDQIFLFWTNWKTLTLIEGQEIRRENWELLSIVQQRKAELQGRAAELGFPVVPESEQASGALRRLVDEILELEQENARELTTRLHATRDELAEMEKGRRDLGKVKKSYVAKRPGVWTSYS